MVEKTKVLILGAGGMLGSDVAKELKGYNPVCWGIKEIDITKKDIVEGKITRLMPGIIINCAAYTDVDGCEKNIEACFRINSEALSCLAKTANKIKATIIHISTDYVFQGDKKEGYKEDEKTNPINKYGSSKEGGEKNIISNTCRHYIIRTSWLFGKNGKNFVNTIIRLAKEEPFLEVVDNQFGCPTYTKDLAKQIRHVIEISPPFGIYHATNKGTCSWFEFAKEILARTKSKKEIKAINSEKLKRAAKRPKYSMLVNTKLPEMRYWKEALNDYLREIGEKND